MYNWSTRSKSSSTSSLLYKNLSIYWLTSTATIALNKNASECKKPLCAFLNLKYYIRIDIYCNNTYPSSRKLKMKFIEYNKKLVSRHEDIAYNISNSSLTLLKNTKSPTHPTLLIKSLQAAPHPKQQRWCTKEQVCSSSRTQFFSRTQYRTRPTPGWNLNNFLSL